MDIAPIYIILVPIVIGMVQVFRKLGLSSRFAPLFAVISGIVGALTVAPSIDGAVVLQGIMVGLSAAGLFSGVKTTVS